MKKNKTKEKDVKNNPTKKKKDVENEKIKGPKVTLGKKEEEKIAKKAEQIIKQGANNMDPERKSPEFIHEINSRNKSVNELLKRAISNANRHGLNLRPGQLNNADGNCLWEALVYNIIYRQCIKTKTEKLQNN